ncbi:hypothetical protein [Oceanithermus sp.]
MKVLMLNWYGPYTDDELYDLGNWGKGLYLITGKQRKQRYSRIQYCGYTTQSYVSRLSRHHKAPQVTRDRRYWLSEAAFPKRVTAELLRRAERMVIYFWEPSLNERGIYTPPEPTTLISRWFRKDGTPRYRQMSIYKNLSDVISWDGSHWRVGNLTVFEG